MAQAEFDNITKNDIQGWSLVCAGVSGEAFSTALAHAATIDLGDAVEAEAIYDVCGRPVDAEADDADARVALVVRIVARPSMVMVCAWCPDAKQRTARAHAAGQTVSHGICRACEVKL